MGSKETNRRMDYVRFDVGHHLYLCHRETVMKFQDSVLSKYVAPQFDTRKSELDYIIIDRDGKHFGSILNYMRDKTSLDLDHWTESDLTDLMREADFYCLTDLVELCEQQFVARDMKFKAEQEFQEQSYRAPAGQRLEIIFGLGVMQDLLAMSTRPTIVISYKSMRKYHIDSWFEELVKLCDHGRFRVYCFASRNEDTTIEKHLHEFIISLYDPSRRDFLVSVPAPPLDKFRARRDHYKCKIFKYWFMIQNDLLNSRK